MIFHEKLMLLRKERGLSQEELGFQLGVTRQTVSKWEMGQTTPEMDKLIELSRLFAVSMDELAGNDVKEEKSVPLMLYPRAFHYEYKSKRMIWGLPLVHINVGIGIRKAKGIVAIGTIAKGIVSLGAISFGVVSLGAISIGLLALGALGFGIVTVAGFAFGVLAIGGISVGLLAVGGVALGIYSIGGFASAANIAMGGYAQGHIAIADVAKGNFAWQNISELTQGDYAEIRSVILREYPHTWKWLLDIFISP